MCKENIAKTIIAPSKMPLQIRYISCDSKEIYNGTRTKPDLSPKYRSFPAID
jgi:hypothetical protein